jgi:glycosyltransferase involved in cell wall biosynthesis
MKEVLMFNGVSEKKIRVLPYFCRWKGERWQPPAHPAGLLFVGRLVLAKGIVAFLDVLKEMDPNVTLDIVGDGPERNNLESKIRALEMQHRVTIHGWLDGEKLRERYRGNAVLIVPSLWPEPFGMVGIEAASHCRPAVAFDVGGISDWLRDGISGFIVKAEQFGEFRARIEVLLDNPDKAREMGRSGQQEIAGRYSADTHLRDLLSQLGRISVEGSLS